MSHLKQPNHTTSIFLRSPMHTHQNPTANPKPYIQTYFKRKPKAESFCARNAYLPAFTPTLARAPAARCCNPPAGLGFKVVRVLLSPES